MTKKETIDNFLESAAIAVAGVSRNPHKFGSNAFRELKNKGFNVVPVNPNMNEFEGTKCYPSVDDIPGEVSAVLAAVSPRHNEEMIKSIKRNDIKYIWMQPGSESAGASEFCRQAGINTVTGECVLMYARPNGIHKFHRFFKTIFGKMPK